MLQALSVPCEDHTNNEIIITIMAIGLAHLYGQQAAMEARAMVQNAGFGRVVEIVPLSKGQLN